MKNNLLLVACLIFLPGCMQASKEKGIKDDSSVTRIIIEDFNENSVLKFSDIYESVKFVKLETSENSLIGSVDKIIAIDDRYIIMDYSMANMVFVFNKDGKFLNRIGSMGAGPEEYSSLNDVAYDKYNDEILVLGSKAILRYKPDGTFAGRTLLDWSVNSIFVVDKDACLLYLNNRNQPDGKKEDYNIMIINKEGKVVKRMFPYKHETDHLSFPRPMFSYYNNEVLFAPSFFNIVYKLGDKEVETKYVLDFGKYAIPESIIEDKTDQELNNITKENYAYNTASFETSTHVICRFSYKRIGLTCYYSKETGKTNVAAVYFNDMYALLTGSPILATDGDSLIGIIESSSSHPYKDYVSTMKSSNKDINEVIYDKLLAVFPDTKPIENYLKILETTKVTLSDEEIDLINSLDESDNPIIMITKLK